MIKTREVALWGKQVADSQRRSGKRQRRVGKRDRWKMDI
ncbi:unnamed protein product [Choristocarpus tenellus]